MKLILGDNQFFGVNHANLEKAYKTKLIFDSKEKILDFIKKSLGLGMDGFMMNSNELGFEVVNNFNFSSSYIECHYSIPYPHKYAGMVNNSGIITLLYFVLRQFRIYDITHILKFLLTFNASYLIPVIVRMEIPKSLPKGSVVYLQNVVTDLIMGLKNGDKIIGEYLRSVKNLGYRPGLITLNLEHLYSLLQENNISEEIHLCFNMNNRGFNVFPSIKRVETIVKHIKKTTKWKLMAMSIFGSGSEGISIDDCINYIKKQELDYIVFGSSNLTNIEKNLTKFKRK